MLSEGLNNFTGIVRVVFFILTAIGLYKTFSKAHQPGILAWIPLVQDYYTLKICWDTIVFWFILALDIIQLVLGLLSGIVFIGVIADVLNIIVGIALIAVNAKLMWKLAKSFGLAPIWAVVSFFLPFVAPIIIGFGNYTYRGPQK